MQHILRRRRTCTASKSTSHQLTETGQSYHDQAVGKNPTEHGLGPPFFHSGTAILEVIHEIASVALKKAIFINYWEEEAMMQTREELA
mmetsp:Transcript_13836/g.48854  ORF Transcript_13836/g.48854 Transcript_13836/m.48854 type:complete len:88 (+) Transcript_13836:267-530(+)